MDDWYKIDIQPVINEIQIINCSRQSHQIIKMNSYFIKPIPEKILCNY